MIKLNRSIERGLTVLEVVHTSGASSLAFLAAQTGLAKPTLLRICATLENRRWLIRRSSDGCYQLGSAFPHAYGMPDLVDRLVAVGKEEIVRLSEQTGLGVDLAAAIGEGRTEIVDTTRVFKKHGVYPDAVGFRPSPILSALGSAYISALSPSARAQALRELVDRLPREDTAVLPQLLQVIRNITEQGYAARAQGHWGRAVEYGELPSAIAVPILAGREPVGAINLVWNAGDRSVEDVAKDHLARLQSAAKTIGQNYQEFA
ncbi:helix-turn-helix domain-containing protein [Aliiroseovarius sp. F47248L]|uniref:IclR family transcriptional regulator n=1 Tax=Aliiroseovarius sp. F47248L TaxID=2926420 RepID=UPI001FF4CA88|nr:helix-turn-helix domain-containing protein [Aliiroseovarius sp. F47248L]MCK0139911.1 helix-turn-helix domain-containing protein [Aliiroseovarius sp. F47248L]